jgi:3-dehydrotetronate 4-kinase
MKPIYGIVSDDFTGGLLIASFFEKAGIECPVYFNATSAAMGRTNAPIVVIAGRTRLSPPQDALAEVSAALDVLDSLGCSTVGYKACATFDSTPDGNIGPVADLMADRYDQRTLLISAGFPEFGTTVFQGHMFVRGSLVNESIKRFDPVTPMPDPNLVRFLSLQTRTPVGLIPHEALAKGPESARKVLEDLVADGHRHVLCDCVDAGDVDCTAKLANGARAIVASDALVIALGLRLCSGRRDSSLSPCHAQGPVAVLVGSVGPVAETQLASFEAVYPVLRIDLLNDCSDDEWIDRALSFAEEHRRERPFAITTCTDTSSILKAQARLGRMEAARRAEALLAGIAVRLHTAGIRRFVVSGGETSGSIIGALGIEQVRSIPRGALGGGFCVAEGPDPVSFFLKSGKLGVPEVLLRAVDAFHNETRQTA